MGCKASRSTNQQANVALIHHVRDFHESTTSSDGRAPEVVKQNTSDTPAKEPDVDPAVRPQQQVVETPCLTSFSLHNHILGPGRRGYLLPEGKGYTCEAPACWPPVYLHGTSGIKVWGAALDLATPTTPKKDLRVVFLYTQEATFNLMLETMRRTESVWVLLARTGVEAPYGPGLYTSKQEPSCLSPGDLSAMGISTGPADQALTNISHFCVPVIAPKSACCDAGPQQSLRDPIGDSDSRETMLNMPLDVCVVSMEASEADSNARRTEEVRLRSDIIKLQQAFGGEHPLTLAALNALALRLKGQGRGQEAEPLYRKVLAGSERAHGKLHRSAITAANNLALCLDELGRPGEAEPLYRRALEGDEQTLGAEHPDTLSSINNLALCLKSQGRLSEAEVLYRRALAGREKVLGMWHPLTITAAHNLACCLHDQGRASDAEPLYWRSLESKAVSLGETHPDALRDVNNLALCLDSQGRARDAEPLHWRALKGKEKTLGAEHPSTLTSMANLAFCLDELGKADQAEDLYRCCFFRRRKVLGPTHMNTLISAKHLSDFLDRRHRHDEANAIRRMVFQATHTEQPVGESRCLQIPTLRCGPLPEPCTDQYICYVDRIPESSLSGNGPRGFPV